MMEIISASEVFPYEWEEEIKEWKESKYWRKQFKIVVIGMLIIISFLMFYIYKLGGFT